MPIRDPSIAGSFGSASPMGSRASGGASSAAGAFSTQIDETNRRIDGVLRHQNPSPEVRAKIEELRRSFNERMSGVARSGSDRTKMMQEYRAARGDLSDALTQLLGGPKAG